MYIFFFYKLALIAGIAQVKSACIRSNIVRLQQIVSLGEVRMGNFQLQEKILHSKRLILITFTKFKHSTKKRFTLHIVELRNITILLNSF